MPWFLKKRAARRHGGAKTGAKTDAKGREKGGFAVATWAITGGRSFDGKGEAVKLEQLLIRVHAELDREIRLAEDDVVLPGLIDFHAHVSHGQEGVGAPANVFLQSGVLAVADAGTEGWANWLPPADGSPFPQIKSWISLLSDGLAQHPFAPRFMGLEENEGAFLTELFETEADSLIGLKIRLGQHDASEDERLLTDGVYWSRRLRVPLMVHPTGSFLPVRDVLAPLSAGDVLTHVFQGRQGSILRDGRIAEEVFAASKKGVILDIGHGANHFSWQVFKQALHEGLLPDTISTDLTKKTWRRSPVYSLPYVISKMLAAGLTWRHVYDGVFRNPLKYLKLCIPDDSVVVLRPENRQEEFLDAEGQSVTGRQIWRPVLMAVSGAVAIDELR